MRERRNLKKILKLLPLLLVVSLFFSTTGFAKSDNAKKSLVALGDSIPFGFGLTDDIDEPSRDAFPYLIGKEADLRVRNLAVPGWTTTDLLNALNTDQKFIQAVSKADYITLNIGSNDLLKPLKDAYVASGGNLDAATISNLITTQIQPSIPAMQQNILSIVGKLTQLNPDAKIVLYNFYNPFLILGETLNTLLNQPLEGLNSERLVIANAYLIGENPLNLIPGDIHPSLAGHQMLAQIGLEALGLN